MDSNKNKNRLRVRNLELRTSVKRGETRGKILKLRETHFTLMSSRVKAIHCFHRCNAAQRNTTSPPSIGHTSLNVKHTDCALTMNETIGRTVREHGAEALVTAHHETLYSVETYIRLYFSLGRRAHKRIVNILPRSTVHRCSCNEELIHLWPFLGFTDSQRPTSEQFLGTRSPSIVVFSDHVLLVLSLAHQRVVKM